MKFRISGARPFRALFASLVAAQVGYSALPERDIPAATRAIVVLMLATSTAEAAQARNRRGAALTAVAGVLGFGAELVGVRTGRPFGHYRYSDRLGPRLAGVPILAAGAWAMMARPSWIVAGTIDPRPTRRVPLAAAALTAWDVFLDPRMARDGFWTWPDGGRYEGIPATNFAGWFLTGTVVFTVWSVLDPDPPGRRDDGALALYGWTWIGETIANAALWKRPRVALAGGAAMGALAGPALGRRWSTR